MLKVKRSYFNQNGHNFDHELEDGTLLHVSEWNGECYTVKEKGQKIRYFPIEEGTDNEYKLFGFEAR